MFVRAWVWVGGSIKYLSKRLPKMSTYSTSTCLHVKCKVSTLRVFQTKRVISFPDCYCAQVLCATQQSPIQSQFEQSLLTVQNVAQRTFSLLFPLLRLGRSAQISCAVRGPICDLISTDGSVSESIVSPFV